MERDAGGGEEGELEIRPVVRQRVGEQPARGGDQGGGVAPGGFGAGYDPVLEHAREGRVVPVTRVGVYVYVVQGFGGFPEVDFPNWSEREWCGG